MSALQTVKIFKCFAMWLVFSLFAYPAQKKKKRVYYTNSAIMRARDVKFGMNVTKYFSYLWFILNLMYHVYICRKSGFFSLFNRVFMQTLSNLACN